jgi:calcineurin-like phosphoesterase family protein
VLGSHVATAASEPGDGGPHMPVTVMAAGDVACDPASPHFNGGVGDAAFCQMKATSDLVMNGSPNAVLAIGDLQYENGTLDGFEQSYDPTWGRFKAMTYPVLGNHEYQTPGAAGYFAYFGALAGPAPGGYYSFDLGDWHIIALNSECAEIGGCGPGSPEEQWLQADLHTDHKFCTLAFWHDPRFTSGRNRNHPELQTFWEDLYARGVDVVLNGHDHIYERFAPQNPAQAADPEHGIREFIVGTGGNNHQPNYGTIQPNSEVRNNTTYGVLSLTLSKHSYDWQFLPDKQSGNGQFVDSGSGQCHGVPEDSSFSGVSSR